MQKFLICLLLATVVSATRYSLKDGEKTCFLSDMTLSMDVVYPTDASTKTATVNFDKATVTGTCEKEVTFSVDDVHNFTMVFEKKDDVATLKSVVFAYNLGDLKTFPESSSTAVRSASADVNQKLSKVTEFYQCSSFEAKLIVDGQEKESVDAKMTDVKIQAFGVDTDYSKNAAVCEKDTPATTTTTESPTTTAVAPSSNTFSVEVNKTVCLVMTADSFNITSDCDNYEVKASEVTTEGECGTDYDVLRIQDRRNRYSVELVFGMINKNYHLANASVTVGKCNGHVDHLTSELRAPTSNVYRCNAEQTVEVSANMTMTFAGVRLQAFRSDNTTTLDDTEYICMADSEVSNVVPIAVGCALAGLIVIVLIAYIIGRLRRTSYQQV